MSPSQWETIPELIHAAKARLSPQVWDYSAGGAETEVTLRRNHAAFEQLAFRPRVLRDVRRRDLTSELLGVPLSLPVLLAPVGSIMQFDPDGAVAVARAAESAGTAAFIGCLSSPSVEDVRTGSGAPLFLQLYYDGDHEWVRDLVMRAEALGYRGICLTVDTAVYGRRERDLTNRFRPRDRDKPNLPDLVSGARGDSPRATATWDDVEWLRSLTELPLIVKGVLGAPDAVLAVERGVDAVYVSNHGGRQMDHLPSTIEVLPEVVDAVGGRIPVIVDSGFMRGSDVLKALAVGADAVAVGKLMVWALAAGGVPGLVRALDLLRLEMTTAMATLGVTSLDELGPEHLRMTAASALCRCPACGT